MHGLRRDETPPVWKPVPGIDYEITNSPAEVVEIEIMHVTELTIRRCNPYPSQVAKSE